MRVRVRRVFKRKCDEENMSVVYSQAQSALPFVTVNIFNNITK